MSRKINMDKTDNTRKGILDSLNDMKNIDEADENTNTRKSKKAKEINNKNTQTQIDANTKELVRRTFRITEEHIEMLQEVKYKLKITLDESAREAIEDYYNKKKKEFKK